MRLKSFVVSVSTLVMVLGFSISVRAETGTSGSADIGVFSNYVWRGQKLSNTWVIQPSAGITRGGFGANLWANYDTDTEELTETDITFNYARSIDRLSIEGGFIYYGLDSATDTGEIYLSAGYDILLEPALAVYYDFNEGDGGFVVASIGRSFEFDRGISLGLGASAGYNLENKVMGDFSGLYNGEVSVSLSIPAGSFNVEPVLAYSLPLSDDAKTAIEAVSFGSDGSIFYGGVSANLSF